MYNTVNMIAIATTSEGRIRMARNKMTKGVGSMKTIRSGIIHTVNCDKEKRYLFLLQRSTNRSFFFSIDRYHYVSYDPRHPPPLLRYHET